MNDRDRFINWLYNNDQVKFTDCQCVIGIEAYDEYNEVMTEKEMKESMILAWS